MILYNLRHTSFGYLLAKFDDDFNVEAVYELTPATNSSGRPTGGWSCNCPAGPRPSCRHRKMLPIMKPKADTEEFYCYETQTWHRPITAEGFPNEKPMGEKLEQFTEVLKSTAPKVENCPFCGGTKEPGGHTVMCGLYEPAPSPTSPTDLPETEPSPPDGDGTQPSGPTKSWRRF